MADKLIKVRVEQTLAYCGRVAVAGEEMTVNAKVAQNLIERNIATVVGEIPASNNHVDDELNDMKVDELIEYAKEADVDLKGATKKADIIAAIREAM